MACTSCKVSHCILAPTTCNPASPGGWQRLWFANRCDISALTFESIRGVSKARVQGITLESNTSFYSFAFYKNTGLQFDSQAVDENGIRWDHTVTVPLAYRDADTMAAVRSMFGAELFLVGLHRDGRYWAAGIGEEGFQLSGWNDTKGRVATDGSLHEVSFTLSDSYPQTELLLLPDGQDPLDLEAREAATRSFLSTNTPCA